MDFFEKIYTARTLLSLNQKEASEQSGINQVSIGILERGERNAIPVAYANFLYKNGIDLNWVFDKDGNEENVFRKEENNNDSDDKLLNQDAPANIIINRQLLETIHLAYTLTKHLEKLHTGLSKMKRFNNIIKIKSRESKNHRKIQNNK
jgi:transcriptional regulator with XRE-family HTH domain